VYVQIMSGYARKEDVLGCPGFASGEVFSHGPGGAHDWMPTGYQRDTGEWECSWCAALLSRQWWGWDFKTGLEHFEEWQEDHAEDDAALRLIDPQHGTRCLPVGPLGAYVNVRTHLDDGRPNPRARINIVNNARIVINNYEFGGENDPNYRAAPLVDDGGRAVGTAFLLR
jgi:hypothetical protein